MAHVLVLALLLGFCTVPGLTGQSYHTRVAVSHTTHASLIATRPPLWVDPVFEKPLLPRA